MGDVAYYPCLSCGQPVRRSYGDTVWGYVHYDGYAECRPTYASAASTYIGDGKWGLVPIPKEEMRKWFLQLR